MAKMGLGIYGNGQHQQQNVSDKNHHHNDNSAPFQNTTVTSTNPRVNTPNNHENASFSDRGNRSSPNNASSGNIDQLLREFRKELDSIKSMDVVSSRKRDDQRDPSNENSENDEPKYYGEVRRALKNGLEPVAHKYSEALRDEVDEPEELPSRGQNQPYGSSNNPGQDNKDNGLISSSATRRNPFARGGAPNDGNEQKGTANVNLSSTALNTSTRSNAAPSFLPLQEPQRHTFHSPTAGLSSLIHSSETQEDIARRKQVNRILGMPDDTPLRTPNFKVFEGLSSAGRRDLMENASASKSGPSHSQDQDINQLLASLQKNYQRSNELLSASPFANASSTPIRGVSGRERFDAKRYSADHALNMSGISSGGGGDGGNGSLSARSLSSGLQDRNTNRSFQSLLGDTNRVAQQDLNNAPRTHYSPGSILSRSTQKKFNDLKSRERLNFGFGQGGPSSQQQGSGSAGGNNSGGGLTLGSAAASNADTLRIENMQLRAEVNKLNSRVVGLESRVDGLQQNLETLIKLLFDQQQ
eukprot:CAMPEP_0117437672 /NCGR_PEP_ID=MMETSP0759-20121206/1652_1 /TAXON_ID=63605 /ORGANISM="Percolomonas cosmopolitus, Strain WS" /LENGTH=526 /DNA_ID=CAMNT_0005229327 /DNA_START=285 /DNA_END=1865 /DNA_ORIENTATION=+